MLDRLGFFDVYASPWFAAIYLLLFISLVGCVLPRIRQHARAMRAAPAAGPAPACRGCRCRVEFTTPRRRRGRARPRAEQFLRARRWRVRTGETATEPSAWVAAEKGYLRETGNLVFHLALLFVLLAVAVGGLLGWKGNVIVREGAGFSNTLTQYDAWGGGRLRRPVGAGAVLLHPRRLHRRLRARRRPARRAAAVRGRRHVPRRARPPSRSATTIEVNHPLDVDGAKVFLVGHGYAPRFVIRDSTGDVVFDDSVVFLPQDGNFTSTGVVKVPDATPSLGLNGLFLPTAAARPRSCGPHSTFPAPDYPAVFLSAFSGDLGLDSGQPAERLHARHVRDDRSSAWSR